MFDKVLKTCLVQYYDYRPHNSISMYMLLLLLLLNGNSQSVNSVQTDKNQQSATEMTTFEKKKYFENISIHSVSASSRFVPSANYQVQVQRANINMLPLRHLFKLISLYCSVLPRHSSSFLQLEHILADANTFHANIPPIHTSLLKHVYSKKNQVKYRSILGFTLAWRESG